MEDFAEMSRLLADLEENCLISLVENRLKAGDDPMDIIDACRKGMQIVGERFESKQYFVSDLVMSGEIFSRAMALVGPHLKSNGSRPAAKVVVGTALGDIHDIGKNIVVNMLRCNGFEVFDLGVDVPPQRFVDMVRETGATIVGISALLTVAFPTMKETIQAFVDAGLRDKIKIMVGGGPVDESVSKKVGADAYGGDAVEAVRLAQSFTEVRAG